MSPTDYDYTRNLLHYIKASTASYAAYYAWRPFNTSLNDSRSRFLSSHRRDWELCAALYRAERLRQMEGSAQ